MHRAPLGEGGKSSWQEFCGSNVSPALHKSSTDIKPTRTKELMECAMLLGRFQSPFRLPPPVVTSALTTLSMLVTSTPPLEEWPTTNRQVPGRTEDCKGEEAPRCRRSSTSAAGPAREELCMKGDEASCAEPRLDIDSPSQPRLCASGERSGCAALVVGDMLPAHAGQ